MPTKKMIAKKISTKSIIERKKTKNKTVVKKSAKFSKKVSTQVTVFLRTANKSQEWIKEMHHDLKWMTGDSLYHLLRAVLHSLRDQLNTNCAAHFAAQLPLLLRGAFYEGWDPQVNMRNSTTKSDFLETVKNKMSPITAPNFDLEQGVSIALNVIKKHISSGEMNDIIGLLNPSLKVFIQKDRTLLEASL